jgi:hypothetical protein
MRIIGGLSSAGGAVEDGEGRRAPDTYGYRGLNDGPKSQPSRVGSVLVANLPTNLCHAERGEYYTDETGREERNDGDLLTSWDLEVPD